MKYDLDAGLREIMRRSEIIKRKTEQKKLCALSLSSAALLTLLISFITFQGENGGRVQGQSVYGAFLLSPEAGGYVLAAVAAFTAGVILTLLIKRYQNKNSMRRFCDESKEKNRVVSCNSIDGAQHDSDERTDSVRR